MRICALSDLHGNLIENIEPCELVLICGDIVPLYIQRNIPQCEKWLKTEFAKWVNSLPCEEVIFIAGNHDFCFAGKGNLWNLNVIVGPTDGKAIYLENSFVDYLSNEGKVFRIFGTPDCHIFGNWAFMYSDDKLYKHYSLMPENCDILISHDAPDVNDLGLVPPNRWHSDYVNAGNPVLTRIIQEKKPRYAFNGHIHEGNHELTKIQETITANVSILNDRYDITYNPLYLDI